jgi:acyl carrier protein
MSDFLLVAVFVLILVIGLLVLPMAGSALWYRFHPRTPTGVRFSAAAEAWAESRFSAELRPMAAFVADLLCEQLGIALAPLEPQSRFTEDLSMDDLEPVEVVMALEEELGIDIPAEDSEHIPTISELVHYLHHRVNASKEDVRPGAAANKLRGLR